MSILRKKGLAIATAVYWFLLLYIVAVLVWWFIALQQQNRQMTDYKLAELSVRDPGYAEKLQNINREQQLKATRNIGEGASFLLVIIIGAVLVYRIVRRQFRISQQQQNFIMAVTHELKTPIAITKLNLETLQKHKLDAGKQQKLLSTTLEETERLNTLTSNILISFQLDGGRYRIAREDLDLSALTATCVQQFSHRFPDRAWKVSIEEDVAVNGDPLLLQILINNLLENAIKYSPKGSPVAFRLAAAAGSAELAIADRGPGIPEGEKKRIFERFYRMGDELTRKTKGTGLGLYLCRKIARDHHATIHVLDGEGGGSRFVVNFRR
ncbi:MAG: two-component sensor histidine kinase [Williamsia sp.]|nr:two-component sensor histidine kinase [Williamsia sp.]